MYLCHHAAFIYIYLKPLAWFKEYSHTYTDQQHGAPQRAVYFYECYDFPNHYIHWHCGDEDFAVDCEVRSL